MKVILCTGGPQSDHEKVFDILLRAGLAPAQAGRQAALGPQGLQEQLLRSQEFDLNSTSPLTQVQPGKLWSQLATDLFLTNINEAAWGWDDCQTTVLMDFWHEFDPQVRLLLVYNSPQTYLAQMLDQHTPPTPQAVSAALNEWMRWNITLLRYYHRHPDCCLLVNAQQACMQPQMFVDTLSSHWQLSGSDSSSVVGAGNSVDQHLQTYLIDQIIDSGHPALALHQELEGAALLALAPLPDPAAETSPSANSAWADWVQVRESLAKYAHQNLKLIADSEELVSARAQLNKQIESITQANHFRQENDRLLLQLHQVQEQLAAHILKNHTLEQQCGQIGGLEHALAIEQAQASKLLQERDGLAQATRSLQAERDQLTQATATLQAEQVRLTQALDQQTTQLVQATRVSAHTGELAQENELLLLQLHQVQEELEHYFLRAQELEQGQKSKATGFVADFWRMHQPTELVINMLHDIAGSNWYPAESDGRWAGPATFSTLQMPPVQPGNYTLEIDIVDAMDLGLVSALVVEALGQTQPVEVFYPLYQGEYPLICKVPLSMSQSAAERPWDIGLRFAKTVSPADSGSDDRRNLTVRLRSVKLVKQA